MIIVFAIVNSLFLFYWLVINDFSNWAILVVLFLLSLQFVLSIYCYSMARDVHNWLFYEVYTCFNFSLILFLLAFSGFISKIHFPYIIYLFIFLYIASYKPWYKISDKMWNATFAENVKSGKFDLVGGRYSIVHQPAIYKFKDEKINKLQTIIAANSAVIIGIAAYYGIRTSKTFRDPSYAMGVAAMIGSLLLAFASTYTFINLKRVLKWEKENKRKMKTAYL